MAIDVQQIYDRVRQAFALPLSDEDTYTPDEILSYTNEAIRFIAATGHAQHTEAYIAVSAGQRKYKVDDGMVSVEFATLDSDPKALILFDPAESADNGGAFHEGKPTHYSPENDSIILWPIPSASHTLNVYYVSTPPEVTTLSSTIGISPQYLDAIRFYVTGMCYLREDLRSQAEMYMNLWDRMLGKATAIDANHKKSRFGGRVTSVSNNVQPGLYRNN